MKKCCLLVLVCMLLPINSVHAFNFTVTPLIEEYTEEEATPGSVLTGEITVRNNNDERSEYTTELADFYYDENGTMIFYEEETPYPEYALADWIDIDRSPFTLGPQEHRVIPYTITVPENAQSGGHYGVIFFRSTPKSEDLSGTVTTGRLGTLILVTTGDDLTRSLELASFYSAIDQGGLYEPQNSFYEDDTVSFIITGLNTGNTYFEFNGTLTIEGDEITKTIDLADQSRLKHFPGIPKESVISLDPNELPEGEYTATIRLLDGDGNKVPEKQVTFAVTESANSNISFVDFLNIFFTLF